jgi:hypothetical protein
VPALDDGLSEYECTFHDEVRGRRRTREEDDVRYGKRRRLSIGESSPLDPVPSLVGTGSFSSVSATPSPEVEVGRLEEIGQ